MFSRDELIESAMLAAPTAKGWGATLIARVLLAVESDEAKTAIQKVLNDDTWRAWRDEEFWSQDWASMDVVTRCLTCARKEKALEPLTLLRTEYLPGIVEELRTFDSRLPQYGLRTTTLIEKSGTGDLDAIMGEFPSELWLDQLELHLRGSGEPPLFLLADRLDYRPAWAPKAYATLLREPLGGAMNRRALATCARDIFGSFQIQDSVLVEKGNWLFWADIDHLKLINDRDGIEAGSAVIREVVTALQEVVGDRVIRYGGDEFLVLLESGDEEIAEMLRKRTEKTTSVTISIGVTRTSGDSLGDVQRAQAALGRAKFSGRNQAIIAKEASTQ